MKKNRTLLIWSIFILLGLLATWPLLTTVNLNLKYDWGFALFNWNKTWHDATAAWGDFFLGQAVGINTAWLPLLLMSGFGLLTGIPVVLAFKVLVLATIVFGGVGFTLLLKNRGVVLPGAVFGGVIYALSPLLFIRVVVGFVFYLIALAIVPWLLKGWFITLEQRHRVWWGYLIPVLFALSTAQPQFAVMILLIMVIDWLAAPNINYFRRALGLIVTSIFSALLLQLPWLVVVLRGGSTVAANINNLGSSLATIASLPHSLIRTLIGADHHITFFYFDRLLQSHWFVAGSFGMVLLAVLAPILAGRRRETKLMAVILGLGWTLSLGTAEPTGRIYTWLYQNLPFTNLFREVYHWEFLVAFGLAFLAATSFGHYWQRSRQKIVPLCLGVLLLIGFTMPYWKGGWPELIGPSDIPDSYRLIAASHDSEIDHTTRSLFLPPLGFIKFKADQSAGAVNNDIYALSTDRAQLPADASILDLPTPNSSLRSAIVMSLYSQDPYLAGFMRAVSGNNIFVRDDLESEFPALFGIPRDDPFQAKRWYEVDYDKLLANQTGIEPGVVLPGVKRYTVTDVPTLISLANQPITAAFDWRTLARYDGDAVFYLEDLSPVERAQVAGLTYYGTVEDRLGAVNQPANLLNQMSFKTAANVQSGWTRPNGAWWVASSLAYAKEPYLFTTNAVAAGPISSWLNLVDQAPVLLIKYWTGLGAQQLNIDYGEFHYSVDTAGDSRDGEWQWQKINLPTTSTATDLILTGVGYTGVAQTIVELGEPIALGSNETIESTNNENDRVVFAKINNNLYNVKVNLTAPRWLIFRMAYDRGWRLTDAKQNIQPLKVNGWAMAWSVPAGSTEYELRFEPSRSYTTWQIIAFGYSLTLVYLAWRLRRREPV